tara:strand:- start:759 stop:938 length:180 start_codon:yes stop_codon:yes gene_type:complete
MLSKSQRQYITSRYDPDELVDLLGVSVDEMLDAFEAKVLETIEAGDIEDELYHSDSGLN